MGDRDTLPPTVPTPLSLHTHTVIIICTIIIMIKLEYKVVDGWTDIDNINDLEE